MPLDPSIALQYRLPQIDNPLQTAGQAMTLRNAMLQNEAAERSVEENERLRALFATGKPTQEQVMAINPKMGLEFGKSLRDQSVQETTIEKNKAETLAKNLSTVRDMLVPVNDPQAFAEWRANAIRLMPQSDKMLPREFSPETKQDILMKSDQMIERLAPKVEPKREIYQGDEVVQQERLPDATWREIGRGPRFAKQVGTTVTQEAPVTPVTIQDPQNPNATIIVDGRTGKVIGKGPKLTDTGKFEAKRQFNMQGIGATIQAAENILTGRSGDPLPTESGFGTAVDYAASLIGVSPSGSQQADQLRALGGALVAKMPRMEGPQSDKDVALYKEAAGRIGDSTIPIARRKAALETVKELWTKYERLNPEGFAGGGGAAAGGVPSQQAIDAEIARRRGGG